MTRVVGSRANHQLGTGVESSSPTDGCRICPVILAVLVLVLVVPSLHAACPPTAEDDPVLVHNINRDPGTGAVRITFDSCPTHLYELRLLPAPTNTADAATTVLETLIGVDGSTLVTDATGPITAPRYYQIKRITFDGDEDNDSLANLDEFQRGLDINDPDSDADTLLDGWEVFWGLDPLDNTGDHGAPSTTSLSSVTKYFLSHLAIIFSPFFFHARRGRPRPETRPLSLS